MNLCPHVYMCGFVDPCVILIYVYINCNVFHRVGIIRMNVKNPHYDITEWHLSKSLVDLKPLGISMFVI